MLVAAAMFWPAAGKACAQSTSAPGVEEKSVKGDTSEYGQVKGTSRNPYREWLQTFLALAVVVGLIFALRYLLRRFARPTGPARVSAAIDVLTRVNLSGKHQLILVRLGKKLVLLGAGAEGLAALSEVSEPHEVADLLKAVESGSSEPFAGIFRRKAERFSGGRDENDSSGGESADTGASGAVRSVSEKLRSRLSGEIEKENQ